MIKTNDIHAIRFCILSLLMSIGIAFFSINLSHANTNTEVNLSPLFIELSDAMDDRNNQDEQQVKVHLEKIQSDFQTLTNHDSNAGKQVEKQLETTINAPNKANFDQLSKDLLAFQNEQNPPDYTQQRKKFNTRVLPVYDKLNQAIVDKDLDTLQVVYKQFNDTWTFNESVVRATSLGHYGQVETAMTYIRVAMLADPPNYAEMQKQSDILGIALDEFVSGKTIDKAATSSNADAPTTLADGIKLLEKIDNEFEQNNVTQAQTDIATFIQQWTIFEGEVSTRDSSLYTRVESQMPVIMAQGDTPKGRQQLQTLIEDLKGLSTGSYGVFDAMLILLREGVEALLIIMALLTALTAAKQTQGKKWVYAGAGLGIVASLLIAVALQKLFPTLSAGTNREILEGLVGIFAVLMMLVVGAWLHSKSSIDGWKRFIDKQLTQAMATGSLVSMLSLSFLAVFREGAETVLFYAGMLPKIAMSDFLMGIGLALILLAIIAFIIAKTSTKLPIHRLFQIMTWLIYFLGFKILGVSIHALQLTKVISTHLIDGLPTLAWFGFYPTWEGVIAQAIYVGLVIISIWWLKSQRKNLKLNL